MKKLISKILAFAMVLSMVGTVPTLADTATGSVTIHNSSDTGICIGELTFDFYQIFVGAQGDAFAVGDDFMDFFSGTLDDVDGNAYDFDAAQEKDDAADKLWAEDTTGKDTTTDDYYTRNYADLVAEYITSYDESGNMAILADLIRAYILDGSFDAYESATVGSHVDDQDETLVVDGLAVGYYFIMDETSTINGVGIAADGAFVTVTAGSNILAEVKTAVPTVEKEIWHDDQSAWDTVGDYAIGDEVEFRVSSTLPSDIRSYSDYIYILTDVMTDGLEYNDDVALYLDDGKNTELSSAYYTVYDPVEDFTAMNAALEALLADADAGNSSGELSLDEYTEDYWAESGCIFLIIVDAYAFKTDNSDDSYDDLYTFYSATVTDDAVTSTDFETNTIGLTYSNNPHYWGDYTTVYDQVFGYTFDLDVNKIDAYGVALEGVEFTLYDGSYNKLFLKLYDDNSGYTTPTYYIVDESELTAGEDGCIVTDATGKFTIRGLNDSISYILDETGTPEGYVTIDAIQFSFNATYTSLGVLNTLTSTSSSLSSGLDGFSATIINRKESILPDTGGMGTVIFQVAGVSLMASAAFLLIAKKKKHG